MPSWQENISRIHHHGNPHNGLPKFFYDHSDRDKIKRRAQADFLNLFDAYGGRRGRSKALFCLFHPDKKKPSASIHQGLFHCFACGVTYDPFAFVQQLEHCDFPSALAILARRYGVSLKRTKAERRECGRRHAAEAEAKELLTYRRTMVDALLDKRAHYIERQVRCLRVIIKSAADTPTARRATAVHAAYDKLIMVMEAHIDRIQRANWEDLAVCFQKSGWRSTQPHDQNREAEQMTAAVIALLVRAQQRDGDVPTEPQKLQQSTPIGEATRIDEMVNGYLLQIPYHPVGGAK